MALDVRFRKRLHGGRRWTRSSAAPLRADPEPGGNSSNSSALSLQPLGPGDARADSCSSKKRLTHTFQLLSVAANEGIGT